MSFLSLIFILIVVPSLFYFSYNYNYSYFKFLNNSSLELDSYIFSFYIIYN